MGLFWLYIDPKSAVLGVRARGPVSGAVRNFRKLFRAPRAPGNFPPPGGPPGTPLRGGPWGVRLGSRMGSGSGVPPDPGIGGLGPALGQGTPYRGPGIVHRGGDSIWGDTPQTPRVMPAAPGGTVPPGPPQGSELPDPDRARGAGPERAHVMSGPEGRWQKDRPLMTADQSRTRRESGVPPGPGRRPAPPGPGAPPPGLAGVLDRASARKAP